MSTPRPQGEIVAPALGRLAPSRETGTAARLTGQTAVVTGGTRGIGAAISRALLAEGARVLAIYAQDDEAARSFAGSAAVHAERLALHRLDVTDGAAIEAFFAGIDAPLQILVNNAGIRQDALLGLMPEEAWQRVLEVNLTGAFHMCKYAVRAMMSARYGRIVSITSPSAFLGMPGQANYAASKAGLVAMTRSLAREVAARGITVNCVSPGFVLTDMIRGLPAAQLERFRQEVPMQRFGEPEEVAAAVLFLVSPEASYITGATLPVTGGV